MSASSADFPRTSYRQSSRSRLHRLRSGDAGTNGADACAAQVDEMAMGRIGRPGLPLHGLKQHNAIAVQYEDGRTCKADFPFNGEAGKRIMIDGVLCK